MYHIKFLTFWLIFKLVVSLKKLTETTDSVNIYENVHSLFRELNIKDNKDIVDNYNINVYFNTIAKENNINNEEIHKISANKISINGTDLSSVIDEVLNEDIASRNGNDTKVDNIINFENVKELLGTKPDDSVHPGLLEDEVYLKRAVNDSVENDDKSDSEFWYPSGRRIYQGKRTKVKNFPFMASIEVFKKFQCAGSIIKSDLVITAASCLQLAWNNRFFRENPAFLAVRIGSTFYNGGGEVIAVLEVYFHPSYDPKTLRNNICLMRLVRRIKFRRRSKRVRKIDIDREDSPLPLNTDGIAIVGWGAQQTSNNLHDPWENRLAFSVLDIYPNWECKNIYSSQYVTHKNFCAGFFTKGGGACNHDVGGPGIVNGILTGIISFGAPVCGASDAPTVFVKVGYYADWIDEIMAQDVPHGKHITTLKPPRYTRPEYYAPETTTFKIEPLDGNQIASEISVNILRQTETTETPGITEKSAKSLFQDFLRAMFSEKDIEEYADLIDTDVDQNTTDNKYVTKLDFDVNETTKTGTMRTEFEKQDEEINIKSTGNNDNEILDENILTLLYLSDNEKKEMAGRTDEDGISIATETFRDLTHRSNASLDLLPGNEIYEIIAEAVDEVKAEKER